MVVALLFTAGVFVHAQENGMKEATETYNSGATVINDDPAKALEYFEKCLAMCDEIGEDADELRLKAERPIANLFYKVAMDQYSEGKYEEALKNFEKAYDFALLIEDTSTEQKAQSRIPLVYLGLGNEKLKAGQFNDAIANYEKALELDKRNEKAFLYISNAYSKLGNMEKVLEYVDKAIEFDQTGPKKTAKSAQKLATALLLRHGQEAYKAKNWDEAISSFNKSLIYSPENKDVAYLIMDSYFKSGKEAEAIQASENALAWETGGEMAKARTYFLLGQIYQKMGDVENACDAFKKASFGEFKANADYQIEFVLKCK